MADAHDTACRGAGREHLVEALLVVGEAGKDRRDQDAGADAGLGEARQDLEALAARRRSGSTTRLTSSSSVPTLMETVSAATSCSRR